MNNFFTQLKEKARATKLSHDEKQVMRVRLYNYLEQNPQNNAQGTFTAPAKIPKSTPSPLFFFSPRYMVPIALLLVVGLSGGTALAAQGALPGSPLYAVKIHVNEPVQMALATTPVAKAQVQARLATARLEEAETLAANGTLDATTTAELARNFNAHAEAVQAVTNALASNDPGTAAQIDTDFNSTLAAHGSILAQIGDNSKSDETMQNSNALAMQVEQQVHREGGEGNDSNGAVTVAIATGTNTPAPAAPQNGARVRTFAAMAPRMNEASGTASSSVSTSVPATVTPKIKDNNATDARVAASLALQASSTLAILARDFEAIKPTLDGTTSAQIVAQIGAMQTGYVSANASLASGDTSSAKNSFSEVVHSGIRLDAYLKAGQKFNLHLLSGLLENPDNNNNGSGDSQNSNDTTVPASTSSSNSGEQDGGKGSSDGGSMHADLHL